MSDRHGRDDRKSPTQGPPVSGQLLRLSDFDRNQPARILNELRAYWHDLRHGRSVPCRSDIDPRDIPRVLDHAFILERIAPGAARFRLAGSHLIDLMGMEVRGMPACAYVTPTSRGRFSDVLESVFKAPQIAEMRLQAPRDYARPPLEARMLLLPLRSDLGDVTRALGCLVAEGALGAPPRRFDLVGDEVMPIIEGGVTLAPSPSMIGFAEDDAPFEVRRTGRKGVRKTRHAGKAAPDDPAPHSPSDTPEGRRARFRIISSD